MNYKKGIDSLENRKLRRTRLDEQRDQSRTRRISQRRQSGENDGLRGNLKTSAKIDNAKIEQSKPRFEKKVCYAWSARDKLTQFYTDHNPTKLADIDAKLKQYANKEGELFAKLAKKYSVDPSVFGPSKPLFATTSMDSGIAAKKSSPTNVPNDVTPSNNSGSAFAAYAASSGMISFGSLASPKKGSSIFGVFGSINHKPSTFGDNTIKSSNKGRTTITSLRTCSDGFRGLDNGDDDVCDSDDLMECD